MKTFITKKQFSVIILMFVFLLVFTQPIAALSPTLKMVYALGEQVEFVAKFEISPELVDFAIIVAIGLTGFCLASNRSVITDNSYHRRRLK